MEHITVAIYWRKYLYREPKSREEPFPVDAQPSKYIGMLAGDFDNGNLSFASVTLVA